MDLNALARSTGLEEAERALEGSEWTLEFVTSLVGKFSQELAEVQLELSKQVYGQVEDAKFAAVVIGNAEQDLKHVVGNFSQLSAKLQALSQTSNPFEALKRASTAKRNLSQVSEQIELYRKVPIRVRRLMVELDQDPSARNLRRVFREWLGICVWRDRVLAHVENKVQLALQSEKRSGRRARGEVLAEDTPELAMADAVLPASSQTLETQLALLKDHFRDSFLLGDRLTEICQAYAPRLIEVGKTKPQDLVVVAEICELGDRQVNRERGNREQGKRKLHFLQLLGEHVDAKAASKLASLGPVSLFTSRANELLQDLHDVAKYVQPCFPAHTMDVLHVYRKWVDAHLLRECTSRNKSLESEQERLDLATWVAQYVREMPNSSGLERFCDSLVDDHLQLQALPRIDFTSAVSKLEFFQMLHSELDICLAHFTGERLLRVFQALVEVCVLHYLEHRKSILNADLPVDLCEFIDDCADCEDELRLLFDSCTEQLLTAVEDGNVAQVIGKAADLVEEACRTLQQAAFDFAIWPLVSTHVFAFGCNVLMINTWFFSERLSIKNEAALARTLKFAFDWLVKTYVQNALLEPSSSVDMEADFASMLAYFDAKRELMWMSKDELERRLALLVICAKALRGEESYGAFLDHFNVRDAKLVLARLRQLASESASEANLDQEFSLYETNQLAASRVELDFAALAARVQQQQQQQ